MDIHFTKLHGLGNDYLYIDATQRPVNNPTALAIDMSHRHLGVGADGIILVMKGTNHPFRMRIFNADGSEAETCGNGIRCFAKYVYERGMTNDTEFTIETMAGPNRVQLTTEMDMVTHVRSNMGIPKFERAEIPMMGAPGKVIEEPLKLADGREFQVTCVSLGNPHAVIFVPDVSDVGLDDIGPKVETHPAFPARTNVEFVSVRDERHINMRIWERGSGETMASGSGSCAAALACMVTNRTGRLVTVHLTYGSLVIEWADDGCVYQQGPAREVFSGTWSPIE